MVTATDIIIPVSGTGNVGSPGIDIIGSLLTNFSNVTSVPSNTSIWNPDVTVGDAPLIATKTVFVIAEVCDFDLTFTVTTVDANGEILEYIGDNILFAPVPAALPASVTVTSTNSAGGVTLHYNGVEPWSVTYGSAHRKSIIV